MNFMKAFMRTS